MRVLVTGGAGFIGSHVVDLLLADHPDVEVVVVDSLDPSAHAGRPDYLRPAATYHWGDLRNPAVAAAAVDGVDAVFHQAARVGLGVDFDDVDSYVGNNDLGTANLLKALHQRRFSGRLVLASSMVVYGEGRYRCEVHGAVQPGPRRAADLDAGRFEPPCPVCRAPLTPEPVPESAPLDPRNVYAATKVQQEHLGQVFARETGASVIALRYHNVYGPRMPRDTPYAGVASIFRSALAAGRSPQVHEDGGQLRDFVHVRDVARANLLALAAADASGGFNVCSGRPASVGEMASLLATAMGGLAPQLSGRYRLGDVRHVFASPSRAEAVLGFTASVGLSDGMAEFARAPLRHPVA
jgi:dTDP-L-rhamnose 4-epimerase